jgi:hypothetical protein
LKGHDETASEKETRESDRRGSAVRITDCRDPCSGSRRSRIVPRRCRNRSPRSACRANGASLDPDRGNSKGGNHHKGEDNGNYGGPFFRPVDAGYFHQCYGGVDVNSLPPGLQKHVARTDHLPPGLEKHLERNG